MEEEIENRINDALRYLKIDCPECEYIEDDQYTCTTCWHQGGNGKLNVSEYIILK